MTENEQVEEMAEYMLKESISASIEPVLEIDGKELVLGENATKILNNILEQAFIPYLARKLHARGYRKVERGEWVKKDDPILGAFYLCSVCKCEWFTDGLSSSENENNLNFCPNCGADMRGEGNAEIR